MANFTPGPWNIHPIYQPIDSEPIECANFDALTLSIAKGEKLIGEVAAYKVTTDGYSTGFPRVDDYDECRANAHIFAAAPEMYEALKAADASMPESWAAFKKVRAALAKAEGKAAL